MITAIILAAGKGDRTALSQNKIKYNINDIPMFLHSYNTFKSLNYKVIIVANKEDINFIKSKVDSIVIEGGKTRQESAQLGLNNVNSKYVIIHDAARPFICKYLILNLISSLDQFDAAMICKKPTSTFYNNEMLNIDRNLLIEAETPQAFKTSKIKEAFSAINDEQFTDDISIYLNYFKNEEIGLIFHETNNEKLTTRDNMEKYLTPYFKIGHAYDIHQLVENRKLILGGVEINYTLGLLGHSDADVVYHAIAESIFGALGIGDLGTHFPDTDSINKDLNSEVILNFCKEKLKEFDFEIGNIDVSIYAEAPKLANYLGQMKNNIAKHLSINVEDINIKAATNEKLDAIGNNKAIAAEAVTLIKGFKI